MFPVMSAFVIELKSTEAADPPKIKLPDMTNCAEAGALTCTPPLFETQLLFRRTLLYRLNNTPPVVLLSMLFSEIS